MALESFYGGKPGISPVIRASFKYIDTEDLAYQAKEGSTSNFDKLGEREKALLKQVGITGGTFEWNDTTLAPFTMDVCFSDPEYRDVWYSELCIIDTENKLNPNNGKLFRRTLKRVETTIGAGDTLYAEYIGQIVGPSGGVPKISFGSVDDVRKQAAGLLPTLEDDKMTDEKGNPTYLDISHWDYSYPKNEDGVISTANLLDNNGINGKTREKDYEDIWVLESNKNDNAIAMVPGKQKIDDDHIEFKDNIRYTWCNVRRNLTNSDDAWFYLGFEIPYTSWDVEATHIPYWLNTSKGNVVDIQKLNEDDENDHPFYHNLHFYIPRGTRGIGPEELILVKSAINNNIKTSNHPRDNQNNLVPLYNIGDIQYDSSLDKYSLRQNAQPVDMNNKEDSYWIAKWTLYNPEQQAFGQYSKDENGNIIYNANGNNTNLTNANFDGSINAGDQTSYEEIYIYLGEYKDIAGVRLVEDGGELQIQYSSNMSQWLTLNTLKWITDIDFDTNIYKLDENNQPIENENYGKFTLTFNTYQKDINGGTTSLHENFSEIIPLIKDIKIDTNRYKLNENNEYILDDNNQPIENENYGQITIIISHEDPQSRELNLSSKLSYPQKVVFNKDNLGKLQFYYTGLSDDDNPINMEGCINDIVDVATVWRTINDDDQEVHLLIKFRDEKFDTNPSRKIQDINSSYNGYIDVGPIGRNKVDIGTIPFIFVGKKNITTTTFIDEEQQEQQKIIITLDADEPPSIDNYEDFKYCFEKITNNENNIDIDNINKDNLLMPWDSII